MILILGLELAKESANVVGGQGVGRGGPGKKECARPCCSALRTFASTIKKKMKGTSKEVTER